MLKPSLGHFLAALSTALFPVPSSMFLLLPAPILPLASVHVRIYLCFKASCYFVSFSQRLALLFCPWVADLVIRSCTGVRQCLDCDPRFHFWARSWELDHVLVTVFLYSFVLSIKVGNILFWRSRTMTYLENVSYIASTWPFQDSCLETHQVIISNFNWY